MTGAQRSSIVKRISTLCRKELRPDLFDTDDPCTVAACDRFNMEYKRRTQDEAIIGIEQKVKKFFHSPVVINEARTMSRGLLTHRVRELRRIHGPEWILATDGSFDPKSNGPACWRVFVLSPSGMCWLFCGATEKDRELEGWHGEEDHTNNTGELNAMLVARLFIQDVASWLDTRLPLNGCETYRM